MSGTNGPSRPVRTNRTAVPTYNLKALTNEGLVRKSSPQTRDRQRMTPSHAFQGNIDTISPSRQPHTSGSSCLFSTITSPRIPRVNKSQHDVAIDPLDANTSTAGRPGSSTAPHQPTYACFNKHGHLQGHYHSARELYSRGVWVGYLAPDKQKIPYLACPSYKKLRANYINLGLSFPPSDLRSSASSRYAVCRGCLNEQSALLFVRELSFAKDKNVVILPLDDDNDAELFCILIPQPLDRSIEKLEVFQPYKICDAGEGKNFHNNIMLLTLRNPGQDLGTMEIVREIIGFGEIACQTASVQSIQELASSVDPSENDLATVAKEPREAPPAEESPKKRTQDSSSTSRNKKRRRTRTEEHVTGSRSRELPETQPHVQYLASATAVDPRRSPALKATSATEKEPDLDGQQPVQHKIPGLLPSLADASEGITTSKLRMTDEQARNIKIVWALEEEGEHYELPLTMAECNSFSEMLEILRKMAEHLPFASALLDKTTHWRMSFTPPNGTRTNKMARKGTEVAFDRIQKQLAQGFRPDGDAVEIELRAID